MSATWEIWLDTPEGERIALLDPLEFSGTKVANGIGAFQLTIGGDFDRSLIHTDRLVEFWRAPEGGAGSWFNVYLIRSWQFYQDGNGNDFISIQGVDLNELLYRRIVAYAAGTAYASKTAAADDMIKAIVRENLGATAVDTDRAISATYFSVAADLADGPSLTMAFAWRNVLEVLQEIIQAADQAGTNVYFDMVPRVITDNQIGFTFTTYTGQPGADKTSDDMIVFGTEWGNLANPTYTEDYIEEATVAYAAGQGEGALRITAEVENTTRSGASPYNRREIFQDARDMETSAGVTDKADAALKENGGLLSFSADLLDTDITVFGRDWFFGDRVIVTYMGQEYEGLIKAVVASVDREGVETIEARVEI